MVSVMAMILLALTRAYLVRSSSSQRDRPLILFLQTVEDALLNGRFQHRSDSSFPYTYQRTNSVDTSIIDYVRVSKRHFSLVKSCLVYNTQRTRSSLISDHYPILLHFRHSCYSCAAS